MTGFGSATIDNENYRIVVELKTINHRFSDIHLKLPKELNKFEMEIRNVIKKKLIRGKLDITIQFKYADSQKRLAIDSELLDNYVLLADEIAIRYSLKKLNDPIKLMNLPNVVVENEADFEENYMLEDIIKCIESAFMKLDDARLMEGANLKKDILDKVDDIERIVEHIDNIGDKFISDYKTKLKKNLEELISDKNIAEERIVMEAGVLADKLCIDEEIVRLRSHIAQTRNLMSTTDNEVGRKLDFILQEFNRESNTILSKSADVDIVNKGLELKYIIEKIREQVQNLI